MAAKDSEHGNNKSVAEKLTPSVLWKSSSDIVEKSTGINEKYFELVDNIKETEHYIKSYQNNAEKNMIEMKNDVASGKMSPIEMAEKQQELIQETKDKLQNVSTVKQVVLYHYMNAIHSLEDKEKDMPTDKQNEMASQTLALKKLVLKINNDTK